MTVMSKRTIARTLLAPTLVFACYLGVHVLLETNLPICRCLNRLWCHSRDLGRITSGRYGLFESVIPAVLLGLFGTGRESFERTYRWVGLLLLYAGFVVAMNLIHLRFDHAGLMWWWPNDVLDAMGEWMWQYVAALPICGAGMFGRRAFIKDADARAAGRRAN